MLYSKLKKKSNTSLLKTRNLYKTLYLVYPINIQSKVLEPNFLFLDSDDNTLTRHPHTFAYFKFDL